MIIGENFNKNYYGYGEENYDYLFKRKSKEERQQKKTERKEKREVKKVIRQGKREEKQLQKEITGTGRKRKLPILGNFGLFDKNKKKTGTADTSSSPSAKRESGDSLERLRDEESKSSPEIKLAAAGAAAAAASATANKTESENAAANESGAEAGAKTENAAQDKDGNSKKEGGFGPMFGFAMLGITVLVVGAILYGVNKKSNEALPAMKVAA
ncbi:MAG: hypothetical protein WAQ28_05855 [Bacteroidia bacterium]|jgi:hypothetical protein